MEKHIGFLCPLPVLPPLPMIRYLSRSLFVHLYICIWKYRILLQVRFMCVPVCAHKHACMCALLVPKRFHAIGYCPPHFFLHLTNLLGVLSL